MVAFNDLQDLFVDQLRDIYNAENQLTKALPKMAKAATAPALQQAFTTHLRETEGHVQRLTQIFEDLGEKPTGKTCAAMKGLIEEGKETIDQDAADEVKDAALIAAAQRVEHYEIAAYGTVRTFAKLMGNQQAAQLLQQTLEEEANTDKKLTQLAGNINVEAQQEPSRGR